MVKARGASGELGRVGPEIEARAGLVGGRDEGEAEAVLESSQAGCSSSSREKASAFTFVGS